LEEAGVALLQELLARPLVAPRWLVKGTSVKGLQGVLQRGAVVCVPQCARELNVPIGPDAEQIRVECAVVEMAQRQSVGHLRDAAFVPVREDVRGLKELGARQPADGAAVLVGIEYVQPEGLLVDTLLGLNGDVSTPDAVYRCIVEGRSRRFHTLRFVGDHLAREGTLIEAGEVDRPDGPVHAGAYAIEVDKRSIQLMGLGEELVGVILGILSLEAVEEGAVL
jgi:hypothetical protein